jgi:hypothetical protein
MRAVRGFLLALALGMLGVFAGAAEAALPTASTGRASSVTTTTATLNGSVNPNNLPTIWHFQYGTTRSYGAQTPNQGPTAAVKRNIAVAAPVAGLAPGTTYHYRLVAVNSSGTKLGGDHTFTTQPGILLSARPAPVIFGRSVVLSGQLFSGQPRGVRVTLLENPFPFAGLRAVATTTTDGVGRYSFARTPGVNTQYAVSAASRPAVQSAPRTVLVRIAVTLGVSTSRPTRGQRVFFSGFSSPAMNGRLVVLERLVGRVWRRVGAARLFATGNPLLSRFRTRILITAGGLYRAHVGHDASHAPGISVARRLRLR